MTLQVCLQICTCHPPGMAPTGGKGPSVTDMMCPSAVQLSLKCVRVCLLSYGGLVFVCQFLFSFICWIFLPWTDHCGKKYLQPILISMTIVCPCFQHYVIRSLYTEVGYHFSIYRASMCFSCSCLTFFTPSCCFSFFLRV